MYLAGACFGCFASKMYVQLDYCPFSLCLSSFFFFFGYSLPYEAQTFVPTDIFMYIGQGACVNVHKTISAVWENKGKTE